MARKVLLLDIPYGVHQAKAGSSYDTVLQASEITQLQLAGAVLLDEALFGDSQALQTALQNKQRGRQELVFAHLVANLVAVLDFGNAIEATFADFIVVAGRKRDVFTGSGVVSVALAQSGHVAGGVYERFIPANQATALAPLPLGMNNIGGAFDATKDCVLEITCLIGGDAGVARFSTRLLVIDPTVATAPALVSITGSEGTSQLTFVFDRAVKIADPTAIALTFTTGTAVKITTIASGQNTATQVVNLSGTIDVGSVFKASSPPGNIRSLYGVFLPSFNTSVIADYSNPNAAERFVAKDLSALADGAPVDTWTDRIAALTLVGTTTTRPTRKAADPLANNKDGVEFDGVDDFLAGVRVSSDPVSRSVCFIARFKTATGNKTLYNATVSAIVADPNVGELLVHEAVPSEQLAYIAGSDAGGARVAQQSTVTHCVHARHQGSKRQLWIDGVLVNEHVSADDPSAFASILIGKLALAGSVWCADMIVYEIIRTNVYDADQVIADQAAYARVEYGTP